MRRLAILLAASAWLAAPALAQDTPEASAAAADEPMSAWDALQKLPPRHAWDLALHVSYGRIAHFHDDTTPWIGFGLRGEWGRVWQSGHRLGPALVFNAEGPIPLYWSASLEPQLAWDWIHRKLLLGASVGPSIMFHLALELSSTKVVFDLAPMAALRIGYSKPWSRIGRRFFVLLEPKGRWLHDTNGAGVPDWSVGLVVGSGSGR